MAPIAEDVQPLDYEAIGGLHELRILFVNDPCARAKEAEAFETACERLVKLQKIEITMPSLTRCQFVRQMPELTSVCLNYTHISDIEPLTSVRKLKDIDLGNKGSIRNLDKLGQLSKRLIKLRLYDCGKESLNLRDLACIGELTQLQNFGINGGGDHSECDFEFVGSLVKLRVLALVEFRKVDLSFVSNLVWLERFHISDIREVRGFANLVHLPESALVSVTSCGHVTKGDVEKLRFERPDMVVIFLDCRL